ncbi:P-selectin glycoprotein ligand 1 [Amblyraja radiata]|uniref:P-selectin glycoprotein ligand 1 n=1 Tax=Amblyraja radiata TaxID=386614 RepID=UPI001402DBCD|nr:P-selectin glycoprotein ligand 1 [Amblyraja radiata]
MPGMWCSLSALLVVLYCLAVMGQDTRDAPAFPTSTSADTSTVTPQNALEKSESTVPKSLVESDTKPRSTSETTAVVTGADASQQQSTWKPFAYSHPPEPTPTAVTPSPSTHPANITGSSPTVSSQSPTTAPIEGTTGSTNQPTSRTVGALSTTGYLSQTTQGETSSQPATTHLMESSTTPGLEEGTNTNGSVHWATDEPKTDLTTTEVTSFSTPTTNTSEGFLGPDVIGKGQHPPSRGVTSTKTPTPGARPTTTASTAVTSSGKLRPAIPTAVRVTTRSRDRPTTAQAATKKIGLVTQCLIVIAFLAGVCTIFVICTIILCTKLSAQSHNYRVNQMNGTELTCISALLPEEERKMRKKLRPKRLREFTETLAGKSSDTDDDDLTLRSFVTEH